MRIKREMCEYESQLDRESSPSDKAADMGRESSLQRTGKAAAMDRGSSPAGKAAVIFIGDEEHLKSVNSPVNNNRSFCSPLYPVSPSGSRHLVVKTEFSGEDKASAKVDQIQHLYLDPEVVSCCVTQHRVIRFDKAERQKHQEFPSKINYANKSLSQGSSEGGISYLKRNMFDYIRESKVFSTVFRYIATNWCARWQDTEHFEQHPAASLAVSLCSWLCISGQEEDDNEGNKSHYCCSTVCAQPKRTSEPQQLEQNSSESRGEAKKVGIFPHKSTTDYISSVRGGVTDFTKSRSGVINVNDAVVVKDVISTDTECRKYREEILYKPLQLHTALSGNEFELGTIDNGAIVYPHSSHVSHNVASERQGLACATNKEFEKEYFNSGREVPQRYKNAYDLRKHQMKLEQQGDQNKVDSQYYKAPNRDPASSSHRRRTIVQSVMSSIAELSELRVSSNELSDRLPISATTNKTIKMDVSSNCMNTCLDDSQGLPNNNNFMQNVRASTLLAADRKTFVEANINEDKEDNEETIIMRRQRLNNQCPTNKTWLNRPVHVKKHYNNDISPYGSCEKVSNVQREQMSHLIQRGDRNNDANSPVARPITLHGLLEIISLHFSIVLSVSIKFSPGSASPPAWLFQNPRWPPKYMRMCCNAGLA